MKNKLYLILFIISLFLIPILCIETKVLKDESIYFYIDNFKSNKALFEEAAELKIAEAQNENYSTDYNKIKKELFEKCRVDSIDTIMDENNNIDLQFSMSNSSYYPSTESKFRMILFQSEDELPEYLNKTYNKRIASNWFFITNESNYFHRGIAVFLIIVYISTIWIFGIVKIIKNKNTH